MVDPPPAAVEAALDLEVRTAGGRHTVGRLDGCGNTVELRVDHPEILASTVRARDVGSLADFLAARGVAVRVVGPGGTVAVLGTHRKGALGAAVTNSNHVLMTPRGLARLARASLTARPALVGSAVGMLLAAVLLAGALRSRRPG